MNVLVVCATIALIAGGGLVVCAIDLARITRRSRDTE